MGSERRIPVPDRPRRKNAHCYFLQPLAAGRGRISLWRIDTAESDDAHI